MIRNFTEHSANERTFLAWLRTGIALFGLGFVVSKVALIADVGEGPVANTTLYSVVGVVIVLCGAVVVFVGYRQHAEVAASIAAATTASPVKLEPLRLM